MNPNLLPDLRRKPLAGAALGVAGLLLAMLAVYVGTGLHDGFGDWALPLAVLGGLLLHAYYERLLQGGMSGWVALGSVLRAFVHFPLFGALALFAVMWSFVLAGWRLLARLWRRRKPAAEDADASLLRWLPALIAMIFLYTDAVSEDTGERIDPYWLTLAASFWLIDYLIVAFQVAPELRARRRRETSADS